MKNKYLKDLLRVRQLSSLDDINVFDRTLEALASEVFEKDDILDLLSVFFDKNGNEEVMYGLLHLIESNDINLVVDSIIHAAPDMKTNAGEWLNTIIYRLINGDDSRAVLIDKIKINKGTPGVIEITTRLFAMKEDSSEKIRERALFVLSKLN